MDLQGRELRAPMTGDDVGRLQDELRRLGSTIAFDELDAKSFGPTTREAVVAYQRDRGLDASGVVDALTAARLRDDVEELDAAGRGLLVYGRIFGGDGALLAQAFDRDIRSEERLGEVTVRDRTYEIAFTADDFSRAEKARADIVVRVASTDGRTLAESPILFNGPPVARIDVVIGDGAVRGPSEYETLLETITPLLQELPVASLTEDDSHQDVSFLAAETGGDPFPIALLIAAHRLAERTAIPAEVFYGLFRHGLPTRLSGLLAQRREVLTRALVQAAARSIVPARFGAEADAHVEELKSVVARLALEHPAARDEAAPAEVLALTLPDSDLQRGFIDAYVRHPGTIDEFWAGLRARPEYAQHADELQTTVHLAALTGNHVPLVRELARMRSAGELAGLADLARFDEEGWAAILTREDDGTRVGVPPGVPGESDEAKARVYARALANRVEDAFPREYVRMRLESDDALPGRENVRAFLGANPDFDIRTTRLDSYLAEHPAALAGVPDVGSAPQQIKAFQRMYRLTQRYGQSSILLKAGITSAHAITRMGFNVFRETVGPAF